MFSKDDFLSKIRKVRGNELKKLDGVSKTVVRYLLLEAEDLAERDLIAYRVWKRNPKSKINLFILDFNINNYLLVRTLHKSGASRVKCVKECTKKDIPNVIATLEGISEKLGWNLEYENHFQTATESKISITVDA